MKFTETQPDTPLPQITTTHRETRHVSFEIRPGIKCFNETNLTVGRGDSLSRGFPAVPLALATVYLVWGSTYLAVKVGLESLPPFFLVGLRLLLAGGLLYGVARWRGVSAPRQSQWLRAGLVGSLLLVTGLGAVVWAEQTVPSGLAALLISTMPIWMMLIQWVGNGKAPHWSSLLGLVVGLAGVGLLLRSLGELVPSGPIPVLGIGVVLMAAISWAYGSLLSRSLDLPKNPAISTGMQMLSAGLILCALGLVSGEQIVNVSFRSGMAFLYLTLCGSLLAFSAYLWLLRNTEPALVSTYAYVNPVIALMLGCWLGGESVGPSSLSACGVTLVGVALIVSENLRHLVRSPRASSGVFLKLAKLRGASGE